MRFPLRIAVGQGDARILMDARDPHLVLEGHLAFVHAARHRSGRARLRGRRQRNVPLPGEQARRGIEPHPARARQIHFGPGVQIGEVHFGARRTVQRLYIGLELDQVSGHEPRREPQVAANFDQQPGAIAARTAGERQRFFARLDSGLHADQVTKLVLQALIDADQKIHRPPFPAIDGLELGRELGSRRTYFQERSQLVCEPGLVAERKLLRVRLQEEVERIDHGHFRDQIHFHREVPDALRKHRASQKIALRVLLPVEKVRLRLDLQRIRRYRRAAVRRGPQADDLGRER